MDSYKGTGVSPGIGCGKFHFVKNEIDLSIPSKITFKESQQKLDLKYFNLIEKLKKDGRNSEAEVLEAYRLLINDQLQKIFNRLLKYLDVITII